MLYKRSKDDEISNELQNELLMGGKLLKGGSECDINIKFS